ncbi:MAG: MaoC family dehydratase [Hyphomicrobiales bacterium]
MRDHLYFEDFPAGAVFTIGPRRITAEEIIAFAQEFDPQPFHLDEAAGKASILGGLAASGWHTTSLLFRMMCDACISRSEILGSNLIDEVKWLKPVLADDELAGEFRITSARPSGSRPDIGILKFEALLDGNGARKAEMRGMFFMRRRPS